MKKKRIDGFGIAKGAGPFKKEEMMRPNFIKEYSTPKKKKAK